MTMSDNKKNDINKEVADIMTHQEYFRHSLYGINLDELRLKNDDEFIHEFTKWIWIYIDASFGLLAVGWYEIESHQVYQLEAERRALLSESFKLKLDELYSKIQRDFEEWKPGAEEMLDSMESS
jgi:hypothetical protein